MVTKIDWSALLLSVPEDKQKHFKPFKENPNAIDKYGISLLKRYLIFAKSLEKDIIE